MIDYDDDLGETMDAETRMIGMTALQILESALDAVNESKRERTRLSEKEQEAAESRWNAHAQLARRDLDPVMRDDWWADRKLEDITARYVQARGFAEHDESFVPYRDRIESKARELRDLSPDQILEGPVPPGPRAMSDEQVGQFMSDVAPRWYQEWAGEQLKGLGHIDNAQDEKAEHTRLNDRIRSDFEHYRDNGTLSDHAKRVQADWVTGDRKALKARRIDPEQPFVKLDESQRREYGWRPGGTHQLGPLGVDDARLVAATTAPKWYRLQEQLVTDLAPALRERMESRLVEDMTALRDTGHLDTASAREEWARFSGHPMSVADQDPNESLAEFRTRREREFGVHWALTEHDRERSSSVHGPGAAKPMSVEEAEQFAERYAPDWLRERHREVMDEHAKLDDPERVAYEQTNTREQFRYAMEEARDTGSLSHPYAANLRDRSHFMGHDESEGMAHVPPEERVRFGGPETRPLSNEEAQEIMSQWSPAWYRDAMNRTLREGNELSASAKRQTMDQVRADMTQVRDHGVLDTDHAMRVWASSQPGFDPDDPDSRKALDAREQTWVETLDKRETPQMMDANNRARFGGRGEAVTQPLRIVEPSPAERLEREIAEHEARPSELDGVHGADERDEVASDTAAPETEDPGQPPKWMRDLMNESPSRERYDWGEEAPSTPERPQEAQERPRDAATTPWKVAPVPSPQTAAERPSERPTDTVDRREKLARDLGNHPGNFSAAEIDGAVAADYERPGKPGTKRGGGRPEQFSEWVEQAKMKAATKSKGPGVER